MSRPLVPHSGSLPPEASPRLRRLVGRVVAPVQRFLHVEAAGGIALVIGAVIAMVLANTGWAASVDAFWRTPIALGFGDDVFVRDLRWWVNDGLMTLFFFVVGLEIRRELYEGELSTPRRAALPIAAALGGMIAPALIYVAFNYGHSGIHGWGVPMATDIAFAVGVMAILGKRVPAALRILLLALAVIDDIGAILVIAVFYTDGVAVAGLAVSFAGVLAVLMLQRLGMRSPWVYVPAGLVAWGGMYAAGVHPTLAGVVLGLITPVRAWLGVTEASAQIRQSLTDAETSDDAVLPALDDIGRTYREAVAPVDFLIHRLHVVVAFAIMPLFALANAGVSLSGADLEGDGLRVFLGIVVGLVVGKTVGIWGLSRLGVAFGLSKPGTATWTGVGLVGLVGGIGFTMALFVAELAFRGAPELLATAKLAVLVGSVTAAVLALVLGRLVLRPVVSEADLDAARAERTDDD